MLKNLKCFHFIPCGHNPKASLTVHSIRCIRIVCHCQLFCKYAFCLVSAEATNCEQIAFALEMEPIMLDSL